MQNQTVQDKIRRQQKKVRLLPEHNLTQDFLQYENGRTLFHLHDQLSLISMGILITGSS